MTISLRLSPELTKRLEAAARTEGISKSELVRRCVTSYLDQEIDRPRLAWELGKDLFGKYDSGRDDLAQNAKQIAREKSHEKHRHH